MRAFAGGECRDECELNGLYSVDVRIGNLYVGMVQIYYLCFGKLIHKEITLNVFCDIIYRTLNAWICVFSENGLIIRFYSKIFININGS